MKTYAGLAAAVVLALAAAAWAGGGSATVAVVGSKPITTKQVGAVLAYDRAYYRKQGWRFPRLGADEFVLLREQAIDLLVERNRAHQADARIGISPQDGIVTDAAWRKVTAKVHVTDPALLKKRRATLMHGFVAAALRDYPVTYARGSKPVAEWKLAERIWTSPVVSKVCDLSPGMHPLAEAIAHGCVPDEGEPWIFAGQKPCPLVEQPGGTTGFTSAMENDGFADYATSNAGSCVAGPRGEVVEITAQDNHTPVTVSYLRRRGSASLVDGNFGATLRYPRRLHALRVDELGQGAQGLEVANFALRALSTGRRLPPNGIDVSLLVPTAGFGPGPPPSALAARSNPRESTFPLSLARYRSLAGASTTFQVRADGADYTVMIREGARPSAADRAAVREIVSSIRFPSTRPGRFVNGYYVLASPARYPLGSVTQIAAGIKLPWSRPGHVHLSGRFYLEHTRSGFSVVTWPNDDPRGYKACGPRYDRTQRRFTCPNGAIWDLEGRVVRNPSSARHPDDPLQLEDAVVSFDGYVLVHLPPAP